MHLLVEMMHPDSIYKKHIETFSVIGKQRKYSSTRKFLPKWSNYYIWGAKAGSGEDSLAWHEGFIQTFLADHVAISRIALTAMHNPRTTMQACQNLQETERTTRIGRLLVGTVW